MKAVTSEQILAQAQAFVDSCIAEARRCGFSDWLEDRADGAILLFQRLYDEADSQEQFEHLNARIEAGFEGLFGNSKTTGESA